MIASYRWCVLRMIAQSEENLEAAREHLRGALDELRSLRADGSERLKTEAVQSSLRGLESQIRLQLSLISDQLTAKAGASPAARRRHILEKLLAALNADDPHRPFLQGLITFEESFDLFRESAKAMSRMNLADAARHIEEASRKASKAEQTSGALEGLPEAIISFQAMFGGLRQLIDAQRSYVKTLRDAVLGDVTAQHVTDLTKADDLLRTGLDRIETSAPALERFMQGSGGLDTSALRELIDEQRDRIRNLRQLVGQGLKPKELVTRSSPRFLIYFAVTFVIVLFGSRFSGLIPELGGRELLTILLIALVVSATSAFGYHAGYRWLTSLGGALGLGGGAGAEKPAGKGD